MMNPLKLTSRLERFGLRSYFSILVIALLFLAGAILTGISYHAVVQTIESFTAKRSASTARAVTRELALTIHQPVQSFLNLGANGTLGDTSTLEQRLEFLPMLQMALQGAPLISTLFVGFDDGDWFMLHRVTTDRERRIFQTPFGCKLLMVHIKGGVKDAPTVLYFGENLTPLGKGEGALFERFDPRTREWYIKAIKREGMVETTTQILMWVKVLGLVFTEQCRNQRAVVGASIRTDHLAAELDKEVPTPGSHLALLQLDGSPIAANHGLATEKGGELHLLTLDELCAVLRESVESYRAGLRGGAMPVYFEGEDLLLTLEDFFLSPKSGYAIALAIPREELFAGVKSFVYRMLLGMGGVLLLASSLTWLASQRVSQPLRLLAAQAWNSGSIGYGGPTGNNSGMAEIRDLAMGLHHIQSNLFSVISLLREIGGERDFTTLLRRVVQDIVAIAEVDGGGVALLDADGAAFREYCYFWSDGEVQVTQAPLRDACGSGFNIAFYRALDLGSTQQDRITRDGDPRASLDTLAPGFLPGVNYIDALCVLLHDRMDEPLGVMTFFVRDRAEGIAFPPQRIFFLEMLSAALAIVLETQHLLKGQRDLRDAMIHILAGAIDAKSPYTGGHCARVPVLFQMLLQAASDAREGPLADFSLNAEKWEEARLAAWLHDCGKVTTPEFVMDKATKLETLHNRMHEIRTRFEILKRDAENASLRACLAGADPADEQVRLERTLQDLDDDFAFVASCNSGSETMLDVDVERLQTIAQRTWTRTLDKRLGASREERERMDRAGVPPPPAQEYLLMDAPEHVIPRGPKDRLPEDNPWGFKLITPEALYNRGELYNLSIRKGTLTKEERYKINDHMTRTIIMLEQMPLPKDLSGMPEIAGAHHETMDGTGYPRQLRREEMSWGARMMAIADIFEALTALDRPYKNSKTVREALTIMDDMKKRQQIDADLYELFLKTEIPRRYAEEYLTPAHNDW